MKRRLNINIMGKLITLLILAYNLFIKFFISLGLLPHSSHYLCDLFLGIGIILGIIELINRHKKGAVSKQLWVIIISLAVLLLFCILSSLVGQSRFLLLIWHIRNNYRLFLYLILCYIFLNRNDIYNIFNIGFYVLILHTILTTFQLFNYFYTYGHFYYQDYINGIFGTIKGYNTFSIILIIGVASYFVFKYLFENKDKYKMIISLFLSGWVAAISELKIIYIFIALLLGFIIVVSIKRIRLNRSITSIIVISIATIFSILSLQFFYPQFANFFVDFEGLKNYIFDVSYGSAEREEININENSNEESHSSSEESTIISNEETPQEDVNSNEQKPNENSLISNDQNVATIPGFNRVSIFNIIPQYFFDSPTDYIFGIGAGNAEYSQNNMLCSDFYNQYKGTSYIRFSSSMFLLETGFLGLTLYVIQFVILAIIFIQAIIKNWKNKIYDSYLFVYSLYFCVITLIVLFYDASLRSEASYFYGFLLSCGLINLKNTKEGCNYE